MFFVLLLIYGKRNDRGPATGSSNRVDPCFHSPEQREELFAVVVLWRHVIYCGIASCNIDEARRSNGRTSADIKGNEKMFLLCRTYRTGSQSLPVLREAATRLGK
jgi:hypothetical protein